MCLSHRVRKADLIVSVKDVSSELPQDIWIDKLITLEHANSIAERVYSLSNHWERINPVMSVLGTASYIHGPRGEYNDKYHFTNKVLQKNFGQLAAVVKDYLQNKLGQPVVYKYAYPGFHIFDCDGIFRFPVSSVHKDLQYRWLPDRKLLDTSKTLSFTLCIQLPESGGGMYIFENDKKNKIEYSPGYIVCHNGHTTHMISPSHGDLHRITLQGHCVFDTKSCLWHIYW
jgi:hypothetical protein